VLSALCHEMLRLVETHTTPGRLAPGAKLGNLMQVASRTEMQTCMVYILQQVSTAHAITIESVTRAQACGSRARDTARRLVHSALTELLDDTGLLILLEESDEGNLQLGDATTYTPRSSSHQVHPKTLTYQRVSISIGPQDHFEGMRSTREALLSAICGLQTCDRRHGSGCGVTSWAQVPVACMPCVALVSLSRSYGPQSSCHASFSWTYWPKCANWFSGYISSKPIPTAILSPTMTQFIILGRTSVVMSKFMSRSLGFSSKRESQGLPALTVLNHPIP
jgi:hypothetical protein